MGIRWIKMGKASDKIAALEAKVGINSPPSSGCQKSGHFPFFCDEATAAAYAAPVPRAPSRGGPSSAAARTGRATRGR